MNKNKKPNIPQIFWNAAKLLIYVFLALRACGVVSWPWYVVLSPLLVAAVLWLLCAVVVAVSAVNNGMGEEWRDG